MNWVANPTGKRARQQSYSDAATQTCLTMKLLFGMAPRQTTGFVESLLQLIGLDWVVPDFSTLCRRQKPLNVNVPYRGSQGPLQLFIPAAQYPAGNSMLHETCWLFSTQNGATSDPFQPHGLTSYTEFRILPNKTPAHFARVFARPL